MQPGYVYLEHPAIIGNHPTLNIKSAQAADRIHATSRAARAAPDARATQSLNRSTPSAGSKLAWLDHQFTD
jgi:hypothetical protein